MKCWFCGIGELIWQSDFNTEDYGIEEEGIVTNLLCSNANCEAEFQGVLLDKKQN